MSRALTGPARLIPAVALAAVLATSAEAYEKFPLSAHGDWTVSVEVWDHGGMSCAAQTYSTDGTFDITMTDKGMTRIFILYDNPRGDGQTMPLDVMIEGVKRWRFSEFAFTPGGANTEFVSPITALEFMLDIQKGATVQMMRRGGDTVYGEWSLRGSREAIDGLFECYGRISGVAS